ncbi:MAG: barstar family protein [Gammaproteobacteria bacterium]|nr:barstar family protein [Gammaproteobacteria bacterium]
MADEDSFHEVFKRTFGFPDFYGKNFDAWIDCMTYLDDPNSGMAKVNVSHGEICTLNLINAKNFHKNAKSLFHTLNELVAFVNYRRIEMNENPLLAISYFV